MAVAHTTLLDYLGKEITFKTPVPVEYDDSGFDQVQGKVISVCLELNGNHSLCVLYDKENDSADFFQYNEMIFLS